MYGLESMIVTPAIYIYKIYTCTRRISFVYKYKIRFNGKPSKHP